MVEGEGKGVVCERGSGGFGGVGALRQTNTTVQKSVKRCNRPKKERS